MEYNIFLDKLNIALKINDFTATNLFLTNNLKTIEDIFSKLFEKDKINEFKKWIYIINNFYITIPFQRYIYEAIEKNSVQIVKHLLSNDSNIDIDYVEPTYGQTFLKIITFLIKCKIF